MIDQTVFLGLSEIIWQGIFGFLSTIIVAEAIGFITIHWLSKQEALNKLEGKILNDRITAYLANTEDIKYYFLHLSILLNNKYQNMIEKLYEIVIHKASKPKV